MDIRTLDTKHASYNEKRWCRLDALVKGGDDFKKHLDYFLPKNPSEPMDMYETRQARAHYRSYVGSIVNLYSSWLFAANFSVKATKRGTKDVAESLPAFYGAFQENVGGEVELGDFIKERFVEALTKGKSCWLAELPSNEGDPPQDALEYESRGLGSATLKAVDLTDLYDWEEDDHGVLKWAIVHTLYETRESWQAARDTIVETWRIYEPREVHTFQIRYKRSDGRPAPETQVPLVGGTPTTHGFKRVPIVRMCLPKSICIGEQTYDPQLEHFRKSNALSWLIYRTCYAQPVFNIEDPENAPPTMGTGTAIMLGPDDKFGWTAPPTAPFDVLQKNIDNERDDIYRLVHQMAQAVDNNAETVGRSADSKEIDAAATRIMLDAYGAKVSGFIEATYEIISEARGETDLEWSVEGFAGYDTATVASLIAATKEARALGIPSQTFHKEICTKTALAMLPEVDQRVRDAIRGEIHSATFEVSSQPAEADLAKAKSNLDNAKADSEPVKAQAAMKSASRPQPSPQAKSAK